MLEKLGRHPQIPELIAYFTEGNQFYIVQEYIDGHNLRSEIQPGRRLNERYVLELLQDVLTVLSFVHQNRVIHRDIKPENLVRRRTDGQICLIDFGAVKELSQSEIDGYGRLNTTVVVGTSGYMPIEQKQGKPYLGSDLYALGMVAIEALTGIAASDLAIAPDTVEIQWQDQVTIEASLAEFLTQLTRWHASQRPKSAQEALHQLRMLAPEASHTLAPLDDIPIGPAAHSSLNLSHKFAIGAASRTQDTLPFQPANGTQERQHSAEVNNSRTSGSWLLKSFATGVSWLQRGSQTANNLVPAQGTEVVAPAGQEPTTFPPVSTPRQLPIKPIALCVGALLAASIIWGLGIKVLDRWDRWQRPGATVSISQPRYPEAATNELVCIYKDCEVDGRLRPAASDAYWSMWSAAQQEGIQLSHLGSFQPIEVQREALAGLSESQIQRQIHFSDYHTGYGLALGDAQAPAANGQATFEQTAAYQWLRSNAAGFGFELSYPKGNVAGIDPEPWHWRYVGDQESQAVFGLNESSGER